MASICAIFSSKYHTKQLNPWPISPASAWCDDLQQLSACPGKTERLLKYIYCEVQQETNYHCLHNDTSLTDEQIRMLVPFVTAIY